MVFRLCQSDLFSLCYFSPNTQTHLRATFNHLSLALHHLEAAQQLSPQADETITSHLVDSDYLVLKDDIQKAKDRQLKSPWKRLSSELFAETMEWCDSPSLINFSSTCKLWKESITKNQTLFQHFKMEGKPLSIMKGLDFFGKRSGNSLKSIDLTFGTKVREQDEITLFHSISPSSETLKLLSIAHHGELSETILDIASECPQLVSLISVTTGKLDLIQRSFKEPGLPFPTPWKPKLQTLVWKAGGNIIVCDDSLVKPLQSCKQITLATSGMSPAWLVKLLSSSSDLVTAEFPWLQDEVVADIPMLNLPNLEQLWLARVPKLDQNSRKSFFTQLRAPNLQMLRIKQLGLDDLSSLSVEVSPPTLSLEGLKFENGEEAASTLLESIKHWENLHTLNLTFSGSSSFWNHLLSALSPLCKVNIKLGYKDHFILPKLKSLRIGSRALTGGNLPIVSSSILACMVASRDACARRLSYKHLLLAGSGDFESVESIQSNVLPDQEIPFAEVAIDSIQLLKVRLPLEADESALSWLESKFGNLDVSNF